MSRRSAHKPVSVGIPKIFKEVAAKKFEANIAHAKVKSFKSALAHGQTLSNAVAYQAAIESHMRSARALADKGKTISIKNGVICAVDGQAPCSLPKALPQMTKLTSLKSSSDCQNQIPDDLKKALRICNSKCSCGH